MFVINSYSIFKISSTHDFHSQNHVVSENIEFTGNHTGNIRVNSGVTFIFRGTLIGTLTVFKGAKVYLFGQIQGSINSDEILDIRKTAKIEGSIKAIGLRIQQGAKLKGAIQKTI